MAKRKTVADVLKKLGIENRIKVPEHLPSEDRKIWDECAEQARRGIAIAALFRVWVELATTQIPESTFFKKMARLRDAKTK